MCDHGLPKMPAALEMGARVLCLGERKLSIDHGPQAMHLDGTVYSFEISAVAGRETGLTDYRL